MSVVFEFEPAEGTGVVLFKPFLDAFGVETMFTLFDFDAVCQFWLSILHFVVDFLFDLFLIVNLDAEFVSLLFHFAFGQGFHIPFVA